MPGDSQLTITNDQYKGAFMDTLHYME